MTLKVAVLIYAFRYNQSKYYEPSFTSPDFVSSLPDDHGTSKCSDIDSCYQNNKECNASFGNNYAGNNSLCVNWNKYVPANLMDLIRSMTLHRLITLVLHGLPYFR